MNNVLLKTLVTTALGAVFAGSYAEDMLVNIRSWNGPFLCAETGGATGQPLVANRSVPLEWEQFRLIDLNGGELRYGDAVGFRTWNGTYLGVTPDSVVHTGSPWLYGWETFQILDPNDHSNQSIINEDEPVSLRTWWGGFVQATNGGGGAVHGGASWTQEWETFFMDFLELPTVADRGLFTAAAAKTPRQWLSKSIPDNERWQVGGNVTISGANGAVTDMLVSNYISVTDIKPRRYGRLRSFYSSLASATTKVESISPAMIQLYAGSAYQKVKAPSGTIKTVYGRARIRLTDRGNPLNGPTQRDRIEIWFTPTSSQPAELRRLAQRRVKCELNVGNLWFNRNF